MIDVENEVFSRVANKARQEFPGLAMTSEYVRSPSSFPYASLVEQDNSSYTNTETSSCSENHVSVMYEVNVYSNKKAGKKSECKKIMAFIDKEMLTIGFNRIMLQPIPNIDDATVYRMLARYRAVISKDKTFFRR
jgi:hypothetical protein